MTGKRKIRLPHPLVGSSVRNWLRILSRHALHISPRHYLSAALITATTTLSVPLRFYEKQRHRAAMRRHQLVAPPVFIIGHWRSGTTHMHNLMLQDPSYCTVTLLHCGMPHAFLTLGPTVGKLIDRQLPESRPMDAVALGIHEPMSEDFGLVGITELTHYLSYFFPQHAERLFREAVLFENKTAHDIRRWQRAYQQLLHKVSYSAGSRRLLLKNPPNIGRIPHVLELYPDAKFIHVLRNPYRVHASTVKLMDRFLTQFALQSPGDTDVEEFVSIRYRLIMQEWLKTRDAIPSENFIELRHEDVIRDQVGSVKTVYEQLQLPGFNEFRPQLERYVESLSGYRNNLYQFAPDYLDRVNPYLREFAEMWGYEVPEPTRPSDAKLASA